MFSPLRVSSAVYGGGSHLLKVTDGAADNAYVGRLGEHKANPGKRLCCLTRRQAVSF